MRINFQSLDEITTWFGHRLLVWRILHCKSEGISYRNDDYAGFGVLPFDDSRSEYFKIQRLLPCGTLEEMKDWQQKRCLEIQDSMRRSKSLRMRNFADKYLNMHYAEERQ